MTVSDERTTDARTSAARTAQPAPYELLDDGHPPEECDLLIVGCGNILRGDDAVGPVLVRRLHEEGIPAGVRVVDGGTAGMDVAFGMRGARRVVLIDACSTGAEPGTVYRVPADQLVELPPLEGLHTHNFRWDHALAFADWLLGPQRPTDVTVFLIEADSLGPGDPLTERVAAAMETVLGLIEREFFPSTVTLSADGYLRIAARDAARWFPADVCVARREGEELLMLPLQGAANGGLVLKQCTTAGDRSLLVHEVLGFEVVPGRLVAAWDDAAGLLRVRLAGGDPQAREAGDGDRGADHGRAGGRAVGGLPVRPDAAGGGAPPALDLVHPREGRPAGQHRATDGGTTPLGSEGTR